ncbi:HEAT repeat domain-containing protein, partial [Microcoleus sp. herbarium5]|uniref:HEAT repeat domain-containing protein n=1 Tax=Microcoleus sp. herbarium5 TaxID=3055434 RepID=UPI002FD6E452
TYGFVHRTFLEYFCASEVVYRFEKTRKLSLDELKTEVFGKHWADESWQEALCLIAGLIAGKFTGKLIEFLIEQDGAAQNFSNLFLAAKCLNEVRERKEIAAVESQLLERLKELTNYYLNYYDEAYYGEEPPFVAKIRTQAVSAIAFTWKDDPKTLPWLKQLAQFDDDSDVRQAAVQELARGWKDEPETLPILKKLAQYDNDLAVWQAAAQELARGWKDDREILPWLKQRAKSDDCMVQYVAVQELARGWKNDPETLPWLKQMAQSNDNWSVPWAAVQELAQGWKDDPETLPILKQMAQYDGNWAVRYAAVQKLAQGWKDEPGIFELLGDIAINYPFKRLYKSQDNPRKTALEIMLKQYPYRPKTLEILRDRFANDPDEKVRQFAQKKLTELEKL